MSGRGSCTETDWVSAQEKLSESVTVNVASLAPPPEKTVDGFCKDDEEGDPPVKDHSHPVIVAPPSAELPSVNWTASFSEGF